MTRILDLDKVKQAWDLRKQGKQQKEISEELGLSLRHIQNYLSIDWLTQRGMRALMKGGAQEVNNQLKALGRLSEYNGNGATAKARVKASAKLASGEDADAANGDTTDDPSCQAAEQWADVAQLEGWGVPKYGAPGMLGAWRKAHQDGSHELCALWGDLARNVKASIPFADAYDLTIAGWLANRWGLSSLKNITELYRLYRPWEGKVHRKVYLDEVNSIIGNGNGENGNVKNGNGDGVTLFEELPRRFLYGLPRRPQVEAVAAKTADHADHEEDDDD